MGVRAAERRKASGMRGLREGPTTGTGRVYLHYISGLRTGPASCRGHERRQCAGRKRLCGQRAAAVRIRLYGGGNWVALPGVAEQNRWFGEGGHSVRLLNHGR